jgi:AcrR family transcriptional regulator
LSRQLLRRDERRAAILTAAATAFARGGFAATSMTEVADEAGVTRILLYRHFDSKEALYRAVLDDVTEALINAWAAHGGDLPSVAALDTHLQVARSNPAGYRLLWIQAEREPEFVTYTAEVRRAVSGMADDLVGNHLPGPLRPWAVSTIVAYIVDTVGHWLDHGSPNHDPDFLRHAAAGLRGLVIGLSTGGSAA